jgi:replication factor C subunit 2/4
MLFYGPPGTGKTSTILALAKSLFGPTLFPTRVLELNASDERGISIVREKIKNFARQQLSNAPASAAYREKHPCPPFKIIILDEADSMTQDAQSALRRTMETYSRITRFCLVCNYVTRIIDPVASRCSKFRFKSLDSGSARARLEGIVAAEGVRVGDGAVDALIRCAEGDLRRAITFLQSAARLVGSGNKNEAADGDAMEIDSDSATATTSGNGIVTAKIVEEIAGVIPNSIIDELVEAMQPKKKGSYTGIANLIRDMVADGWSAGQTVSQVSELLLLYFFPLFF